MEIRINAPPLLFFPTQSEPILWKRTEMKIKRASWRAKERKKERKAEDRKERRER